MDQHTGKYITVAGLCILIVGILVYFFHSYFKWFGKLPGDIKIENENFHFYFPVVTMIVISVIITLIANLMKRFF